ncbi:hypothetical protein [Arthrobacter sp. AZCC_0090]|uniref:hypothetical protein n=1 Tax=Arthrobacter sp. AZCC_0090 TaxID=2735881 RepID=UPI00161A9DF3|nr:hypothetical protein [Arthrobacter sp. AZCC_0090]MBB6406193.1 hypothetical protein [Arthrobacter sp. AZCC_0090]
MRDKVTSLFGLGPIAPLQIVKADAVVAEANRSMDSRVDGKLTHAEQVVLAGPVKRAKDALGTQVKGPIEKKIDSVKDLFARINIIDQQLDRVGEVRLVGPNGEQLTPEEAQDAHDTLRDQVVRETNEGSKKHHIRREGRGVAFKESLLLAIDLPIFVYAMCSLLNVNLRLVFSGDLPVLINFGVAVIFGLLGTILFAKLMRTMGRRHRRFKGADSSIESSTAASLRRLRCEQAVTLVVLVAVAFVMGSRVYSEGTGAGADTVLVLALSVMLALLVAVSGYINYQGEYENGSDETDRVAHHSGQLAGYTTYVEGLRKQRAVLLEAAGKACATLSRMIIKAKEQAIKTVETSTPYKTIAIARSYATVTNPIEIPEIVTEALEEAERQAADLASHQKTLTGENKED